MYEAFRIAAIVNISVRGMAGLTALSGQFQKAGAQAQALHERMRTIRSLAFGGALVAGGGILIGAGLLKAANAAGDLSVALRGVQIAGGYTDKQMKGLTHTVFEVSNITARSSKDVAEWMRTVANSANFTADQIQSIMPVVAKFADVLFFTKKTPFEESVTLGIRFAHLFGLYKPAELEKGLNALAAAARIIPGGPQELLTSMVQFGPTARVLGIPMEQQIIAAAFLNRLGMQSRGGTGLMNMLLYGLPTAQNLTTSRQMGRLQALGFLGMLRRGPHGEPLPAFMQGGQADLFKMFTLLSDRYKAVTAGKTGDALTKGITDFSGALQKAFNIRGMRPAALIAAIPASMEQLTKMLEDWKRAITVGQAQVELSKEWNYQMMRAQTNLQNIFLKIMLPFVQGQGAISLTRMADFFGRIADSITPSRAEAILKITAAISGLLVVAGGAMLVHAALLGLAILLSPGGLLLAGILALTAAFILWPEKVQRIADITNDMARNMDRFFGNIQRWLIKLHLLPAGAMHGETEADIPPGYHAVYDPRTGKFRGMVPNRGLGYELPGATQTMGARGMGDLHIARTGPYLLHRGEAVLTSDQAAAYRGGGIHIGAIHITQLPGEDAKALVARLLRALDERTRDAARATGAGILHPLIPAHGY